MMTILNFFFINNNTSNLLCHLQWHPVFDNFCMKKNFSNKILLCTQKQNYFSQNVMCIYEIYNNLCFELISI